MRVATLDLSPELFLEFCKLCKAGSPRRFTVKENPLPDDAKIVRAALRETGTMSGGVWTLFIESESFADVPEGNVLPELPVVVFETVFDDPADFYART